MFCNPTHINHVDLFSGIAGFALAARHVWGADYNNLFFCDYDQFCQRVIAKRFPGATIYGDIRTVANTTSGEPREQTEWERREDTGRGSQQVDLLTGGFPCQPFSQAGRRKGTDDNRYLWPEMLRVIRATKPTWVIAENVRGLLTIQQGMVFEQVCLDLEASGYEVQPLIIPAVAVNAPHRRDRVWFIAHKRSAGLEEAGAEQQTTGIRRTDIKNPVSQRSEGRLESNRQVLGSRRTEVKDERPSWETNWPEVAAEFCSVDDGLPVELDGFKLSKSRHRAEQLKAYGNAIVPQVAVEIMKAIKNTTK